MLTPVVTDMPFKRDKTQIVIFRNLPVLQCGSCSEYLIEDSVLARIGVMFGRTDQSAELQIFRYVA